MTARQIAGGPGITLIDGLFWIGTQTDQPFCPDGFRIVILGNLIKTLGLIGKAKRIIGFGSPVQGFRHLIRGVINLDNDIKPADRGSILFALQIKPANRHFLASKMLFCQVDFQLSITGKGAPGKATNQFFKGGE